MGRAAPQRDDRGVLDYLAADWARLFHLTTIPQAQANLGLPRDAAQRWRLARALAGDPARYPLAAQWGLPTLVLTETEKLLGRWLAAQAPSGQGDAELATVAAAAIGSTPAVVRRGVRALTRLGLLHGAVEGERLTWAMAPDWQQRVGPLGFTWHTMVRASGERFGVP